MRSPTASTLSSTLRSVIFGCGAGGGAAPVTLPAVDTTNLVMRLQPDFSTVTKSGSTILTASDLSGAGNNVAATAITNGTGPLEMLDTDPTSPGFGRKFWRFQRREGLAWATQSLTTTNMAVIFVMRHHWAFAGTFFSIGTAFNASNTSGGTFRTVTANGEAPYVCNAAVSAKTAASNGEKLILGSQLQAVGLFSGSGAGSTRLYMNQDFATVAGPTNATFSGGAIGYYVHSTNPATALGASPAAGDALETFDVYDVLVYNVRPSNTTADTIMAALQTGYTIPTITDSLVLDGDSITQGFYPPVLGGDTVSMKMRIPAGWRVVNVATSGNQTYQRVLLRDQVDSIHQTKALIGGANSGHNRVLMQIGINDINTGAAYTASVTAGVMDVTAMTNVGESLNVGDGVSGSGVPANTVISSLGTGTGGVGTYNLSNSFTITSRTLGAPRNADNVYNGPNGTNSMVSLIGVAVNGYKARGYDKIIVNVNIINSQANAVTQLTRATTGLWARIRNIAQFRTDTGLTAAQLDFIDLPLITAGTGAYAGTTLFATAADALRDPASNATEFTWTTGGLHPSGANPANRPGNLFMAQGGVWDGGVGEGYDAAFTK